MVKTCQTLLLLFCMIIPFKTGYAIELAFPVACHVMTDCWITNHVDLRGTTNLSEDYMCGRKTIPQSKLTHISLGSLSQAQQNYAVVAMADGLIESVSDVGGFCGNRIVIAHESGWKSSYCHLKPDTFLVSEGAKVKRGQILAALGMSGQTEWPRLAFGLTRNGMVFDPFSGRTTLEGCEAESKPLWIGGFNPPYEPAHVTSIGFSSGFPTNNDIMVGLDHMQKAPTDVRRLSLWGMMMNTMKGDRIVLKIETPDNRILKEEEITLDNDERYLPIYFTVSRNNMIWDPGLYKGIITITRNVNGNNITTGQVISTLLVRDE